MSTGTMKALIYGLFRDGNGATNVRLRHNWVQDQVRAMLNGDLCFSLKIIKVVCPFKKPPRADSQLQIKVKGNAFNVLDVSWFFFTVLYYFGTGFKWQHDDQLSLDL